MCGQRLNLNETIFLMVKRNKGESFVGKNEKNVKMDVSPSLSITTKLWDLLSS
jgi:hypothetical protein